MKRVLVTGATGFIGRYSLSQLLNLGYEVHVVSCHQATQEFSDDIRWHCVNLLKADEITNLMRQVKPTHLLHFAWYAVPGKFWTASENLDWVKATISLMHTFSENGGQRVVMAGSCAEYEWKSDIYSETMTPCKPATLYGTSKYSMQMILDSWSRQTNLSSAWGRIFFLYGPNEYESRLVPSVINSLLNGEVAKCSHGNQVRDFMHVVDVANAFVMLLDSKVQGVINIASGVPVTLKDVIYTIADYLNRRNLVQLGELQAAIDEPDSIVADVNRLRNEVGFTQQYALREGIIETIEYMKAARQH